MKLILIDNKHSFTFNLAQLIGQLGVHPQVLRVDQTSFEEIHAQHPTHLVISPGPGAPEDAKLSCQVIREYAGKIPIFGVCLGHQVIGHVFGAKVIRELTPKHGKTDFITHDGQGVFQQVPQTFQAARYHSLVISKDDFPEETLEITATTAQGQIMGIRHRQYRSLEGIQFHPESFMTEYGEILMRNFFMYS
jgi:anthranilate synthase/aminodeoxychorismate synthase-like glutamine amidotransferase